VNHLAGHVGEADAWAALADAPDVLDHLSPGTVAEQMLATDSDRTDWPESVAATVTIQHHLARANPADRPLVRAIEMARQPGAHRPALISTQAHSTGAWRLAWARTQRRPAHLKLPHQGSGVAVVTAVSTGRRLLLAVGGGAGTVQLWNPVTGRRVGDAMVGHTKGVTALAPLVLPGGRTLLASGGMDGAVWLWDLATGRVFGGGPFTENVGVVRALAGVPMPGRRTLLAQVSHRHNRLNLWDPVTGRLETQIGKDESTSTLAVVSRSDGPTLIATGARDGLVRLWDPVTGEMVGEPLTGHTKRVHGLAVLTTPGQPDRDTVAPAPSVLLASYAWDGTVRLWDPDTRECVACYPLGEVDVRVRAIAAVQTHDGRTLLAAAHDGKDTKAVQLRDPRTGEPQSHPFAGHEEAVVSMACLPAVQGRAMLATADGGGNVFVWDPLLQRPAQATTGRELHVSCLAVLPRPDETTLLAAAGTGDAVSVWDPSTGEPVGEPLKVHPKRLKALTAVRGPGGRTVLASARGSSVRLWDPDSDSPAGGELTGHTGPVTVLAAVPMPGGGVLLASGSEDSTIRLWDPATGQLVRQPFTRHRSRVRALATLSLPGGRAVLASAGDDQVVRLWEIATGQPMRDLPGHTRPVTALAVAPAPDGAVLASAGNNGTVRLWRMHGDSADELPPVKHGAPVAAIATLSAAGGGLMFAVVGSDGTLRLVNPSSGQAGPAVSLGVEVETVAGVGSRLVVGSRHGMFALDLQPDRFPEQLQLSRPSGPAGSDGHGDADELAAYHGEIPSAWLAPASGTRWSAVLAGVAPLAEEHLEARLGIQNLEPDRAADIRRWLRVALAARPEEGQREHASVRRHLRYLGAASVALGVHTLLAVQPRPLGHPERIHRAQLLIHPVCAAIADELLLHARVAASDGVPGDADATTEDLALQVLGVVSLNRLDGVRSDLMRLAYDVASREVDRDTGRDVVDQLLADLGTPTAGGDKSEPTRRTPLPRRVIVIADRVARLFGLAGGNVDFQQALTDPSWCPDGHTAAPETHTNAALATLGAFVVNDLYATAVVEALLSRPDAPAAELRHGVEAAALAALAEMLGLRDGLLFTIADPTGGPDMGMMANAAKAVLAAAYLSYKGDARRFSSHMPDSIRSWLQLGVLSVHPTSPAVPVLRAPRRTTPAAAPAQRTAAGPAEQKGRPQRRPPQRVYRSKRNDRGGLVLSRTPGEKIMLGDDIAIEVLQVGQNKVRLRVQAPESLPVKREEIWTDADGADGA
jgi:carbon storage regulator CsrA